MNKIKSIFMGRYGIDQLNLALIIFTLILSITTLLIDSEDLAILCWIPLITYVYRACSKQHIVRYKENAFFMKLINPVLKPIYIKCGRIKDKEHKYCHCPSCNQTIRINRQKGKVKLYCPICKSEFIKK
jgi:hypothetical protein